MSNNLTVHGIKIRNSPQFHFRFDNCRDVYIESIHITAPALSPNTDGIHIENTNDVGIYNSIISNGQYSILLLFFVSSTSNTHIVQIPGDDCVSIGSGCYDVDIKNVTCGPSHGIRFEMVLFGNTHEFSLFHDV